LKQGGGIPHAVRPGPSAISLGKDPKQYQTSYSHQTFGVETQGTQQQLKSTHEVAQKGNITLGCDRDNFVSTSKGTYAFNFDQNSFNNVQKLANSLKKDLRSSHFSMGKNVDPMSTIARESYNARNGMINTSNISKSVPNLRASNLKMGDDKVN